MKWQRGTNNFEKSFKQSEKVLQNSMTAMGYSSFN